MTASVLERDDLTRLDSEMACALRKAGELDFGGRATHSIYEAREQGRIACRYWAKGAPKADEIVEASVPSLSRHIPLKLFLPRPGKPCPVVIFLHGGGWVMGTIEQDAYVQGIFAKEHGLAVVSVDYRLAPENPYPAALDDCKRVVRWIRENGDRFGLDPSRIVLGGSSAGANLAIATALSLRDERVDAVQALVLFCGVFYGKPDTDSYIEFADGRFGLSHADMHNFYDLYLSHPALLSDPYVSPALAELSGLPPIWLGAAGLDVVRDDSITLAARLNDAGVVNRLVVYPGLTHGFTSRARVVSKARESIREAAAYIEDVLLTLNKI